MADAARPRDTVYVQRFMIAAQVIALLIFAAVALIKVAAGDAGDRQALPLTT
mgnify:CR=1 FL=1